MQKKVEEKRKEMEKDKKPESSGGSSAAGGLSENKTTVSTEAHSRQSSAYNTPRNARYRYMHTTYYEANVGFRYNYLCLIAFDSLSFSMNAKKSSFIFRKEVE